MCCLVHFQTSHLSKCGPDSTLGPKGHVGYVRIWMHGFGTRENMRERLRKGDMDDEDLIDERPQPDRDRGGGKAGAVCPHGPDGTAGCDRSPGGQPDRERACGGGRGGACGHERTGKL